MLASSFLDPVLGLDVHFEMVPTPAPVPLPIPNPFTGLVFDPLGLAAGIAIGAAVGAVVGAPFQGPVLYWTAFPATNTGTEAKHVPGHILIPPGTAWAPFPKAPKPVIHPGETPTPALPVKPENDAIVVFGSKTVTVMGSNAVRLGDIALSCSEPLRLPSSVVLAVPKGAPILIGGPMSLDIMAAVLASLRTRFVSDSLHALLSRLKPSRFRNLLHRAVCFFTGHPVDVASGKVMTESVEVTLPGPLPFAIERVYSSAFAGRAGPMGHGWSSSLDQAIWRERGKVVLLSEDGREIELDTFDFPGHRIEAGQRVHHSIEGLTLHCDGNHAWRVVDRDGVARHFGPVPGRDDGRLMIRKIVSRCGYHQIDFQYGTEGTARGRLEWVRDSGGRVVRLVHDVLGRVGELLIPNPQGTGFQRHRAYEYDEHGDLVQVTDSLGHSWRFAYVTHLLTQETDRTGLSFYFQYDGLGEDAWCVRTWGDGGLYDHVLAYDKRKHVTYVTNSLGHTTQYHLSVLGQVVEVVDPLGGRIKHEYDPVSLLRTSTEDPLGRKTTTEYDPYGNVVRNVGPGAEVSVAEYPAGESFPSRVVDVMGGQWQWRCDSAGRPVSQRDPLGRIQTLEYADGLLRTVIGPDRARAELVYDGRKDLRRVEMPGGRHVEVSWDARGWASGYVSSSGLRQTFTRDTEGQVVASRSQPGAEYRMAYDAEGNLRAAGDGTRRVDFRYGGYHRVVERREGSRVERFRFDTEDRLVALDTGSEQQATLSYDERGYVIAEHTLDGRSLRYVRDAAGQVLEVHTCSGASWSMTYDHGGRVVTVTHPDDEHRFEYRPDDLLESAGNAAGIVFFERDVLGRVHCERFDRPDGTSTRVQSRYGADGLRAELRSDAGAVVVVARTPDGEPSRIEVECDGAQLQVELEHDPGGRETGRRFDNGAEQRWQVDASGRPWRRFLTAPGMEPETIEIEWTGDDRISAIRDDRRGRTDLEHDAQGRLTGVRADGELRCGPKVVHGQAGRPLAIGEISLEYDEDGRRTAERGEGHERHYHFDPRGLLRSVEQEDGRRIEYVHDVFGRRVERALVGADGQPLTRERWIWDANHLLHQRTDEVLRTWVSEPEGWGLVAQLEGTRAHAITTDLIGTPTELFGPDGSLAWRSELREPGGLEAIPLGTQCPFRWPGQILDRDTGLLYTRWREYDPRTRGFLTPDPLGLAAGARIWDYVDDPILWIDPLGLADWPALFRGTSQGYPGNPGVQLARRTPTSTNPAIATIFATQSAQHGDGVVHILTESDLTGIRTGAGNVLAELEQEVVAHALPRNVKNRATTTITADAARRILGDMGIRIPPVIRDIAALDRLIRSAPRMSNNQIRKFLRRAQDQNINPKCGR